jgi:hypothetical protein
MRRIRTIEDCQQSPRVIAALANDYWDGESVGPHRHTRARLIHALTGLSRKRRAAPKFSAPQEVPLWD